MLILKGFYGLYKITLEDKMVEAAGIEPASENSPPLGLHA